MSYGPFIELMLATPQAPRVFECFISAGKKNEVTFIHSSTGVRTYMDVPNISLNDASLLNVTV